MKFTLNVKPRTKKNHMQLVTLKTGRQMLLPSKQYKAFEKEVLMLMKCITLPIKEPINVPVNLKCTFYKDRDYRSDLAGYLQAIQDVLVKAGVFEDDNHKIIVSTDGSMVSIDRNNPRIEVEITRRKDIV